MKNKNLLVNRISTGLFSLLMGFSSIMYFAQNDMVSEKFTALGFPTWVIYPLAIAKILGLVAIWTEKSKTLKEWAYAGFAFNLLLAIGAHVNIVDQEFYAALVGLILGIISYYTWKKQD